MEIDSIISLIEILNFNFIEATKEVKFGLKPGRKLSLII